MQLTAVQQKEIEDSEWGVNTALKRQGLSCNEDLRQSAILYMCECLLRYDPTKGIKWTTFAYKNVYLYIKRTYKKEHKRTQYECDDDLMLIGEPIEPKQDVFIVEDIMALCTPNEKKILMLKLQGYKHGEISIKLHCSISKINNYMQSIRAKTREFGYEQQR